MAHVIEFVDLTAERGLFLLPSEHDLLPRHAASRSWRVWHPMVLAGRLTTMALFSIPIIDVDGHEAVDPNTPVVKNVVRVGSRHQYWYDLDPLYDGWWLRRTVQRMERLDRMPRVGQRTKSETGGRQW